MYMILKINVLSTSNTPQVLQRLLEELISEGKLIFKEDPDVGSPVVFPVNETSSFHNKCQNHPY